MCTTGLRNTSTAQPSAHRMQSNSKRMAGCGITVNQGAMCGVPPHPHSEHTHMHLPHHILVFLTALSKSRVLSAMCVSTVMATSPWSRSCKATFLQKSWRWVLTAKRIRSWIPIWMYGYILSAPPTCASCDPSGDDDEARCWCWCWCNWKDHL